MKRAARAPAKGSARTARSPEKPTRKVAGAKGSTRAARSSEKPARQAPSVARAEAPAKAAPAKSRRAPASAKPPRKAAGAKGSNPPARAAGAARGARGPSATPPGGKRGAAEAEERQRLAVRAWVRILAVQKRGLAAIRDELEREMTLPRFDLLANLEKRDGQTLAALSRCLMVTAGNLTGLVDRAARDGLVERRADPDDRRAWRVHILPKGERAFRDAERVHAARVKAIFAPLGADEVGSLVALLDKIKAALRAAEAGEAGQAASAPPAARPRRP